MPLGLAHKGLHVAVLQMIRHLNDVARALVDPRARCVPQSVHCALEDKPSRAQEVERCEDLPVDCGEATRRELAELGAV